MNNLHTTQLNQWESIQWGVNHTLEPLHGWEFKTNLYETGNELSLLFLIDPSQESSVSTLLKVASRVFNSSKSPLTAKILKVSSEAIQFDYSNPLSDFYFGDNIEEKYLYKQIINHAPDLIMLSTAVRSNIKQIADVPIIDCPTDLSKMEQLLDGTIASLKHSDLRNHLSSKINRNPLDVIKHLTDVYGQDLTLVNYTQGVGIYARLSIANLQGQAKEVISQMESFISKGPLAQANPFGDTPTGANLASTIWAYDLSKHLDSDKWDHLLTSAADIYQNNPDHTLPPIPCDPILRTEDMFYSAAVLGRAYQKHTAARYLDILDSFYSKINLQQQNGLFWHSDTSPYYWSRGNGFAILGLSEYLTYVPTNRPFYNTIKDQFISFFDAITSYQDTSGGFHELIDTPCSYLEFTSTCIIGYAALRGKSLGILGPEVDDLIKGAWHFLKCRTDTKGNITDGCFNTGLQPDRESYYLRPAVTGYDDRSGSMALLFCSEILENQFDVQ